MRSTFCLLFIGRQVALLLKSLLPPLHVFAQKFPALWNCEAVSQEYRGVDFVTGVFYVSRYIVHQLRFRSVSFAEPNAAGNRLSRAVVR